MLSSISAPVAPLNSQAGVEQAKLNQLVAQYRSSLAGGSSQSLAALWKQISAEAKLLGQNVTLPTASTAASVAPAQIPSSKSAVSITA